MIQVTQKFRLGVIAATGGIFVFYMLEMILGFFGVQFTSVNGSGIIGIGFSLIVVAIAALNLVLDFDFIEQGVQSGAPATWSGTAPSASWSRWSGSTLKSLTCSPRCAAATKRASRSPKKTARRIFLRAVFFSPDPI